ncbi:MAG: rRNA pseudouridine synthase [Clostridium sp.]|jgi:16S rRNA pseudouridine516 synthase|uniref:pseudouridine synthase n=1 Tax=Clostridium sp. TaxID=1506 RepID=UPI0025C1E4EC|nr:pseudouridine synthase [Clostridium sp.]MCH3962738.1 rRNA pseudouridine synthase [Clostridium sp.]MCI1715847.1 rRNA pseudouridine synthase [Clostridium sp.]MCI1799948.1 rRNA pseudouridine synthase [Clostridium sp.]MCI1813862.1 rRNA pseudouridine synthase [Clostridium sp.]MCI1870760.1 rRNA pseudouridine synthase [Clostridium sp.]
MERLDKILSNLGYGTRKQVKALVKEGHIKIDGVSVRDSSIKVDTDNNKIEIDDRIVDYKKHVYIMMNKPDGVVSATYDNYDETVIDLLEAEHRAFDPFPVGRLDKDTVGLLLITDDGEINHRMISPKWHIDKVYYAEIDKILTDSDIEEFEKGIVLDDGYKCMPAKLEIIKADKDGSMANVTVQEGKFHQVKRMFESLEKNVVYLKRIKFGPLQLDDNLKEGSYRELFEFELESIKNSLNMN